MDKLLKWFKCKVCRDIHEDCRKTEENLTNIITQAMTEMNKNNAEKSEIDEYKEK